jgi:hypothetical protein
MNSKKIVLILAAASMLAACGGSKNPAKNSSKTPDTPASSQGTTTGASLGMSVNYAGDANLLGVQVFDKTYGGAYVYTPHAGNTVLVVPSYKGAKQLKDIYLTGTDGKTIGEKINAKVGTATDTLKTYSGELSLEGIRYAEFTVPAVEGGKSYIPAFTVNCESEDVANAELVTVTLAETNNSRGYEYITKDEAAGTYEYKTAATGIDSGFSTDFSAKSVQVIKGSLATWFIGGANLEAFHSGIYSYTASVEGATVYHNTLEASINDWMKTTGTVKADKDLTVNITINSSYKSGEGYFASHGGSYVTGAFVDLVSSMDYSTHKTVVTVLGANFHEVCFPSDVTIADGEKANYNANDYVTATVTSHNKEVSKNFFKTVVIGDKTWTFDATAKDYKSGDDVFTAWIAASEDNAKSYYTAVMNNAITVKLTAGDNTTLLSKATLNKEDNGYGGTTYNWAKNRNATCYFLQKYGMEALLATTHNEKTAAELPNAWVYTKDGTTIDTGATATDVNSDTTGKAYKSYAQILKMAYDAALTPATK